MTEPIYIDALVVGAGFGGIYATYRLSRVGLSVKCIDMASDVGGTWYWNRYPGAMSDTESYLYRYSWDKEDLQNYPWTHKYVYQPEILKYLHHVVRKHDLRKYMQFSTEMVAATWDDEIQRWRISCATGQSFVARYLITSLGLLSKANYPNIPGISSFSGEMVHTAKWTKNLDLRGKRVGIIGNGSTGVQVMTAIAPIVGELKSFQRSPQYSVPSGQKPIPPGYREEVNSNYDKIFDGVWSSAFGFGVFESQRKTMEASPEERQKAFQKVWDEGNAFNFTFSAFGDLLSSREANEEVCKFIKSKIDEIVKDPRKAELLKPHELYARRPLCDAGYYEIFNQKNVEIVNLNKTPIDEIVSQGIRTADGKVHELDVLILATGFDAVEGNYLRVAITGREGKTIQKHWENGPTGLGSVSCAGFPNMFMVAGPVGPFANFVPVVESEINFIMSCIEFAEKNIAAQGSRGETVAGSISNEISEPKGPAIMEASPQAERAWVEHCDQLMDGSLLKETQSWIFGVNVPGRKESVKFYFGGLVNYIDWAKREVEGGFQSFRAR